MVNYKYGFVISEKNVKLLVLSKILDMNDYSF